MTKKIVMVLRQWGHLTYQFDGPIEDSIKLLQEMKDEADSQGVELVLDYETEYGSYGDSDRQVVNVYEKRMETDEEYQERLDKETTQKEQDLKRKREEFERLKKELGE